MVQQQLKVVRRKKTNSVLEACDESGKQQKNSNTRKLCVKL